MGAPSVQRQMAAGKRMAPGRSALFLQRHSMPCCSTRIMTETEKMETFLKTPHYKAKLLCWQCHKCPKAKVHSWQAPPFSRTSFRRPTGCPCCVGHQLCDCNCLQTLCPDIAANFDIKKTGVSAAEVTNTASARYCWLSDEPGAKKPFVAQCTLYSKKQLKYS
jgi:hypothetical protein